MRLWRFCLAGLVYDWLVFAAWLIIPIRAKEFGAGATTLGLLQGPSTLAYVAGCLLVGRLADRGRRALLVALGCLGATAACIATVQSASLLPLFAAVGLMGLANSLFWPPLQGAIGSETDPAKLERAIGLFNVSWSLGKSLGYVMAGWMARSLSHDGVLWIAAATAIPILLFVPWSQGVRAAGFHAAPPAGRACFRTMAYVANFVGYGVLNTFQNLVYNYFAALGLGTWMGRETFSGIFLGTLNGAQTAIFLVLQQTSRWTYHRGLLYGVQILLAASTAAVALARQDGLILALAPLVGIGVGYVNASSIYYSLHGSRDHGRLAGLHEAILSAGSFLLPFLGGWVADLSGRPAMTYFAAAALVLAGVAVQEAVYRRSSRS